MLDENNNRQDSPEEETESKKADDWQPYYEFHKGYNPPKSENAVPRKKNDSGTVAVIITCVCVFIFLIGLSVVGILGLTGGGLPSLMGGASSQGTSSEENHDSIIGNVSSDNNHSFTGSDLDIDLKDVESSTAMQPGVLVAKKVCPSIVGVLNYEQSGGSIVLSGSSSGIIISEDGFIVTNHHAIEGAARVAVTLYSENGMSVDDSYVATVVGSDATTDIALLKIDATGLTPAEFADSNDVLVGETVYAIGNPAGLDLSGSITQGLVSGVNRNIGSTDYIQTDVAINPGNSGGALVNVYGQVIGIVVEKIVSVSNISAEGLGFAIPSSVAVPIIEELVEHGYVSGRVVLGVTLDVYTASYAEMLGLPEGCCIYISGVQENSNASNAGVKVGLYITHVDGKSVQTLDGLKDIRDTHKPGETITLTLYDSKEKSSHDVSFILEEDRG